MREFLRRPKHYFISYSHKDDAFAKSLKGWLETTCGLQTWFDEFDMHSGERVQANIAQSIGQCRGIIFLISKNSLKSSFVADELDQALHEKKECSRFQIVLLRLDDCNIGSEWKQVRQLKWHDLLTAAGPQLHLGAAAEILCRAHAFDGWMHRQSELREVYVSGGWRAGEEVFADSICSRLAVHGLRLVGDLPNQGSTDPQRIAGIMRNCWGCAFVLPKRPTPAGAAAAYKNLLLERTLADQLGLHHFAVAPEGADLPTPFREEAFLVSPGMLGQSQADAAPLINHIYEFVENLRRPTNEVHAFFASAYRSNVERNELARGVVEATGTIPCYWGRDYHDMDIRNYIKDKICSARFVVADLTSADQSASDPKQRAWVNINASLETAIAWGAGVRILPFAAENPVASATGEIERTRHLPFMLRSPQVALYSNDNPHLAPGVNFLGAVHSGVLYDRLKFGRRVINYELQT